MELSFQGIKNERLRKTCAAVVTDLAFWLLFIALVFVDHNWEKGKIVNEVKDFFILVTPYIVAGYSHSIIFSKFFLQRKYVHYAISCILLFIFFYATILALTDFYFPQNHTSILGSIFLLALMYTGFKYFRFAPKQSYKLKEEEARRVKAERDLQEMESKQAKAELEVLKSQINPHFLFNSLNSIYSLTMVDAGKAGDAILTISDLLRYNLESSKSKFVTLTKEIEFLDSYMQLEALRLGNSCKVDFLKEGDFHSQIIAPMMLIPFVENCFKHGISVNGSSNYVSISVRVDGNALCFQTENRIATARMEVQQKHVKIGIDNVKRRLDMLYPDKHTLNISKSNDVFRVLLTISL
jgi:Putative regulator of cell autolysis